LLFKWQAVHLEERQLIPVTAQEALKADVSEAGEGWSDSRIIAALDTSASMVYRARNQLVEESHSTSDSGRNDGSSKAAGDGSSPH